MKTYARIQNGIVAELLRTDGDITRMFNPALVWVDVSSRTDLAEGWHFDGTQFTRPAEQQPAARVPSVAELQAQLAALSAQIAALSGDG
jgi:hypothetical protein